MNPPPGLHIRALEPSDSLEELTEFFHRAYAHLIERGLNYLAGRQDVETTRARIESGECYVATLDGKFVASVTFHNAGHTDGAPWYDRPDVASFVQLCVAPELRSRGIASHLMDLIERRAAETGANEIACDTAKPATDLIAMYTKRGFRIVADVDWRPTTNYESVILSKDVTSLRTRTVS